MFSHFLVKLSDFGMIAFFTTALCAVIFGCLNRQHQRRETLSKKLDALLASEGFDAKVDALAKADPSALVYDPKLRALTLGFLVSLRRAVMGCTHADLDNTLASDQYHRLEAVVIKATVLIEVVQRTNLWVAETAPWNGLRSHFARPVIQAFRVTLNRPK